MADDKNRSDETAMPLELAREIARQGEARLMALMSLGTAADLRATTLCGIFGASAVALAAALFASLAAGHPNLALIVGGAIPSFGWFLAAVIAGHAGAPRDFYIAGGSPNILREWSWDAGKWRSEAEMLDSTAVRYGDSIAANAEMLERGTKKVRTALWIAFASPVIGAAALVAGLIL